MAIASPSHSEAPLVKIEDASAFIPGTMTRRQVLRHIDLKIYPGRHIYVTGENGAGKSSLLKLIHGDLLAESGQISWLENGAYSTSRITARQICRLVSPQVQESCQKFSAWVKTRDFLATGKLEADKINEILESWRIEDLAEKKIGELSRGQLRLALLARVAINPAPILLLDEFADGLDGSHSQMAWEHLANMARSATIVFTSHNLETLPEWCDTVLQMDSGYLSECAWQSAPIKNVATEMHPQREQGEGRPIFDLKNVTVYIDRKKILENVNWRMTEGEHWHIRGANGSGKSTFLRLLAGDEFAAQGGAISRHDKTGIEMANLEEIRGKIRLVADLSQVFYGYDLSALDLVCSGFDNCVGKYRDYSAQEISEARKMLERFFPDHADLAELSIRRLSTGLLRRLFLARALMGRPQVLLLDEACSGLDAGSRHKFLALLDELAQGGFSGLRPGLVLVSHNCGDLPACVNRFATMHGGHLTVGQD